MPARATVCQPWARRHPLKPSDRPVLITGCSSGIGLATARGLRDRGYPVFASARRPADVERTGGRLYGPFNNGACGQPGSRRR